MSAIIRIGVKSDLPRVLELIKELAVFENAPNEVEVSVDEMMNWGFGQDKIFYFFVLEKESVIVGIAVYYYKYSTWKGKCLFLEDIIVTESERKNGYGKLLFNEVVSVISSVDSIILSNIYRWLGLSRSPIYIHV